VAAGEAAEVSSPDLVGPIPMGHSPKELLPGVQLPNHGCATRWRQLLSKCGYQRKI